MSRIKKLAAQKELNKLKPKAVKKFDVANYCADHQKQLEFIKDKSKRKVASCSRRAGKSQGVVADMLQHAESKPNGLVYYVAASIGQAESIVWQPLLDLVFGTYEESELYIHHSKHIIKLPNGSTIRLTGCPDITGIRSFLGLAYSYVVIDECQDFNTYLLDLLLRKAIIPALIDFDGSLCLIGTPSLVHAGPFYEANFNKGMYQGWSVHNWTMKDNPHLWRKNKKSFSGLLKSELDRRGLEKPDSNIEREWFGKWVAGSEELVYNFNAEKNEYPAEFQLDANLEWHTVVGVDLGSKDDAAFVVIRFSYNHPTMYVIDEFKAPRMDITDLMKRLKKIEKQYDVELFIFDPAAGGANFVDEVNNRFVANAMSAEKLDKLYHQKLFNDTLRQGNLKVKEGSILPIEWNALVYKLDSDGNPKENKALPNHLSDACLYAWRYVHSYAWAPKIDTIGPWNEGIEDEYADKVAEEMRQEREENNYWDSFEEDSEGW